MYLYRTTRENLTNYFLRTKECSEVKKFFIFISGFNVKSKETITMKINNKNTFKYSTRAFFAKQCASNFCEKKQNVKHVHL